MNSKNKPLLQSELEAYEASRDLAAELLQSVREMKAGYVQVISPTPQRPEAPYPPTRGRAH